MTPGLPRSDFYSLKDRPSFAACAQEFMGEKLETVLQGTPVSPGIGIGPVHVVARGFSAPEVYHIDENDIPSEQDRFRAALDETKVQLDELQQRIKAISGEEESRIFEAHLMVLEDRAMLDRVAEAIASRRQNAEFAFYAVMQHFLEAMRRVPDPYLRERTAPLLWIGCIHRSGEDLRHGSK